MHTFTYAYTDGAHIEAPTHKTTSAYMVAVAGQAQDT